MSIADLMLILHGFRTVHGCCRRLQRLCLCSAIGGWASSVRAALLVARRQDEMPKGGRRPCMQLHQTYVCGALAAKRKRASKDSSRHCVQMEAAMGSAHAPGIIPPFSTEVSPPQSRQRWLVYGRAPGVYDGVPGSS